MTIRTKILLTQIGSVFAGLLVAGYLLISLITKQIEQNVLGQLSNHFDTLTELLDGAAPCEVERHWNNGDARVITGGLLIFFREDQTRMCSETAGGNELSPTMVAMIQNAARGVRVSARIPSRGDASDLLVVARLIPLGSNVNRQTVAMLSKSSVVVDELGGEIRRIALAAGLIILVTVGSASLYLSRRISNPVLSVAGTARAIAKGEIEERVTWSSNDEFGQLASAVNDMAVKLNNDIDRLRSLEKVRSEFLGNVSHELRTPIFSIQGSLETLLDGAMNDPSVNRDFLEKAYRHAERLNTLLNDLIEISRIQSGEMKMSFRYFPVEDFVYQLAEEMQGAARKKGITISVVSSVDATEEVYGDRDRLKQVMINLIDNAIKYTESRGRITLYVKRLKTQCEITVEDTGCGIPEAHLTRIFERFYRVDRDRSRQVGGTGLGLSIVKHIVEAHGGMIRAESVVGQGSRFIFTLKR